MKKTLFNIAALCCMSISGMAQANDLDAFGLGEVEPIAESVGANVRGQGAFSTSMSSYQIFAFDPVSGTSVNLQSSNIAAGEDYVVMHGMEGFGDLALSESAVGMSDLQLGINEFSLEISAFDMGAMGSALTATDFFGMPHVD